MRSTRKIGPHFHPTQHGQILNYIYSGLESCSKMGLTSLFNLNPELQERKHVLSITCVTKVQTLHVQNVCNKLTIFRDQSEK